MKILEIKIKNEREREKKSDIQNELSIRPFICEASMIDWTRIMEVTRVKNISYTMIIRNSKKIIIQ